MSRLRISKSLVLVMPYLIWLSIFLLGPLLFVVVTGFLRKGVWGGVLVDWNLDNFNRVFDSLYLRVMWKSMKLAVVTGGSCLLIGYPMAWYMTELSRPLKKLALVAVMLPFMSNFVVRAYAVKFLLGIEGPLNHLLARFHLIQDPLFLVSPKMAIWIGMVTNYLPFLVLPLFVALDRFDKGLLEAAHDLGASSWDVWWGVLLPLTAKPAMVGFVLVFVPALGEFVIPDLMGGGKTMYFGNLLAELFLKSRDWPFGSAMCLIMFLGCAFMVLLWRFSRACFFRRGIGDEQRNLHLVESMSHD